MPIKDPVKRRAYHRDAMRRWRERNPEKNRAYARKYYAVDKARGGAKAWGEKLYARSIEQRFGITMEEYSAILAEQGGVCAICKSATSNNKRTARFSVDHCHETGKVRGLLCCKCNRAIGLLGDRADLLQAGIDYLKRSA